VVRLTVQWRGLRWIVLSAGSRLNGCPQTLHKYSDGSYRPTFRAGRFYRTSGKAALKLEPRLNLSSMP